MIDISHFTVLVVEHEHGPGFEDLLYPFYEGLESEPYWDEIWKEEGTSLLESAQLFFRKNPQHLAALTIGYTPDVDDHPEDVDPYDDVPPKGVEDHTDVEIVALYTGCGPDEVRLNEETGKWERIFMHNPNTRWDWYVVGGRWSGMLKVKEGANEEDVDREAPQASAFGTPSSDLRFADRLRRRALDVDGMRQDAIDRANEIWDTYETIVAEHGPIPSPDFKNLPHTDDEEKRTREDARKAYWDHPTIQALKGADLIDFLSDPEEMFAGDREAYIERARSSAVPGYAFLSQETGWVEPGTIGWFGTGSDTVESRQEYQDRVNKIIDELPGDAWITLVDCHI